MISRLELLTALTIAAVTSAAELAEVLAPSISVKSTDIFVLFMVSVTLSIVGWTASVR